ncbi:MAG: hypothetical protein Q8861_01095 [Bacteroidota bacterium]|nr:hypothetical protein [Bacteroidota bacterium]
MKKTIFVSLFLLLGSFPIYSQYVAGIGTYVSSPLAVNSKDITNPDHFVYEVSLKAFTTASHCFDIIGSFGKEYYNFTLMGEVHTPIAYPFDWYLGFGGHVGSWKKAHWNDNAKHDNTFAGLDGTFGLQCTLAPIAISIGIRPVYNLYGGDQFYWLKQIGLRICFY